MGYRIGVPLVLAGFAAGLGAVACETSSPDGATAQPDASVIDVASPEGGTPEAGPPLEVDCTHPGKGKARGNGKCECPTPFDLTGRWSGKYDCKEIAQNTCFDRDKQEVFTFTQNGNVVHAESDGTFVMDGVFCGSVFVWTGGPKDGSYVECGTLTMVDANSWVKDSCYNNAGGAPDAGAPTCTPSFATGCAGQSGICTNTGARDPAPAPDITNSLCKACNPDCP